MKNLFISPRFITKIAGLKYNYKIAFTLAEVLITLGIIGVVAAMTLPTVLNHIDDREKITKLKKVQSVLSQATLSVNEEHPISSWDMRSANLNATQKIYNYYKEHLQILNDCGCAERAIGCWSKDATKALNGQVYEYGHEYGIGATYCAIRLKDGTNISFDTWYPNELGINSTGQDIFFFYVDVNGDNQPNTLGRDVFLLAVKNEYPMIIPAGQDNNSAKCTANNTTNHAGIDCAAKVLSEDKISY